MVHICILFQEKLTSKYRSPLTSTWRWKCATDNYRKLAVFLWAQNYSLVMRTEPVFYIDRQTNSNYSVLHPLVDLSGTVAVWTSTANTKLRKSWSFPNDEDVNGTWWVVVPGCPPGKVPIVIDTSSHMHDMVKCSGVCSFWFFFFWVSGSKR